MKKITQRIVKLVQDYEGMYDESPLILLFMYMTLLPIFIVSGQRKSMKRSLVGIINANRHKNDVLRELRDALGPYWKQRIQKICKQRFEWGTM